MFGILIRKKFLQQHIRLLFLENTISHKHYYKHKKKEKKNTRIDRTIERQKDKKVETHS